MELEWKVHANQVLSLEIIYRVQTDDGGEYRKNSRMLLKSVETDPVAEDMFMMKLLQQEFEVYPPLKILKN